MAATLGSVVEGVLDTLYGHSAQQDAVTTLTAGIDSTVTSFVVDDVSNVDVGLIEIDSELMRVKNVDNASNTVFVTSRGARGTTAAAHSSGAEARTAPLMPYASVIREVNAELVALYPRLCSVTSTEVPWNVNGVYELPADVDLVLDVRYKEPTGTWSRVRAWEAEFSQNTTDFPTGKAIRASVPSVGTVRIVYGKRFTPLSTLADTLSSAGVTDAIEDILRMGAILRLLPSMDIARLSTISVPLADAGNQSPQPGTGVMVAREIKQQYVVRLEQETGAFRLQYPARCHFTR